MAEQGRPRDIRSFFATFSKPAKRPLEKIEPGRGQSKSPRLESSQSPRNAREPDSHPTRSIVDLVSPEETESEESDPSHIADEAGKSPSPVVDRPASSLPPHNSSFAGAPSSSSFTTSSQRIVKNGEAMVTNSDEDSDSSSAPSLSDLLGIPKPKKDGLTKPLNSSNISRNDVESSGRKPPAARGVKRHFRVDTSVKARRFLEDLAAKTTKERAATKAMQEAQCKIQASNTRVEELEAQINNAELPEDVDPEALAAAIGDDEGENASKLIQAMKRTEALQSRQEWSFFGPQIPDLNMPMRPPDSLRKYFGHRQCVEAALVDGFVEELAACNELKADEDNLEWTLCAALTSPRDDLYIAYCVLLAHAPSPEWLSADWVWRMFFLMGAGGEAIDLETPVKPRIRVGAKADEEPRNWPRVLRILKIIQHCGPSLPSKARREALNILCRLALDAEVGVHHSACSHLSHTTDALLDAIPNLELDADLTQLVADLVLQVPDAPLRVQLLRTLASASPRSFLLRHRLALRFFFENSPAVDASSSSSISDLPARIAHHLDSDPQYDVRFDMDYARLTAQIAILDVALDNGHPGSVLRADDATAFDRSVDRLADRVQGMATRIRDSGANHLSRTEAKETLDALHARLRYAVRSTPRPKRSVFGRGGGSASMADKGIMGRFLKREVETSQDAVVETRPV